MRRFERRLSRLSIERDMQDNLLAKMRSLEEFRSDFISNVTHEIKTPVTGILGAVDVFSDGYSDLDELDRRELLKVMKDQSVRLNALVEDILSLAQLEKAEATRAVDFTDCNLGDVIQTAVNLARPQAAEAGIEIRLDLPPPIVRACEPRLIESAVSNLIRNAIRYSGSKTVDVVVKEQPDGKVSVSVTDYGIGIPIDCQGRLFERFFRVDRDRSRLLGGTGLGLAIVKHIVQLHNGEVSVVSKPGAGATFQIVI